jgi:hypothetical protein
MTATAAPALSVTMPADRASAVQARPGIAA